jgi:hypothetical protein
MRVGPTKEWDGREHAMYDWEGMCSHNMTFPEELFSFIQEQCKRFNLQYPPEEFVQYVVQFTYNSIAIWDPYVPFYEGSEVVCTEEWRIKTYELLDLDGEVVELEPERLETFRYVPGASLEFFNYVISHPGLEALPNGCGIALKDMMNGDCTGESLIGCLTPGTFAELRRIAGCNENIDAYADMISWAAYTWMMGPDGKDFRREMNYVFDTCYEYGECIVYEGCIYAPKDYRIVDRAPQSCVICGLDAWCVEIVYVDGMSRYMCEHHVNPKPLSKFHCGGKFCRYTECPHHPMTGQGINQIDFVRMTHGYQQNMVEWSSNRGTKAITAS